MFTGTRIDLLDTGMRWKMRGNKAKQLEPWHYESSGFFLRTDNLQADCCREIYALDASMPEINTLQAWTGTA